MKLFFYLLFFQYVTFNIYIHYVQMYHRGKYAEAKINPAPAYPSVYSSTLNIRFPRRDGYPARLERRHSAFSLLNKGYRTPPAQPPLKGQIYPFSVWGFALCFRQERNERQGFRKTGKDRAKTSLPGALRRTGRAETLRRQSCDGNAVSEARAGKLGENAAEERGGHFTRQGCAAEDSAPVTAFP